MDQSHPAGKSVSTDRSHSDTAPGTPRAQSGVGPQGESRQRGTAPNWLGLIMVGGLVGLLIRDTGQDGRGAVGGFVVGALIAFGVLILASLAAAATDYLRSVAINTRSEATGQAIHVNVHDRGTLVIESPSESSPRVAGRAEDAVPMTGRGPRGTGHEND